MLGGGTGPATGTFATTCTPGRWNLHRMLEAAEAYPMNLGFLGKGNCGTPEPLRDQILAGAIEAMQATGARVVVIGPVVEYDGEAPQIVADALMRGDPERAGRRRIMERRERDRAMAPVVKATGADWISAWDIECPADRCRLLDDEGGPMHFDYGHVTQSAAKTIVSHLPAF